MLAHEIVEQIAAQRLTEVDEPIEAHVEGLLALAERVEEMEREGASERRRRDAAVNDARREISRLVLNEMKRVGGDLGGMSTKWCAYAYEYIACLRGEDITTQAQLLEAIAIIRGAWEARAEAERARSAVPLAEVSRIQYLAKTFARAVKRADKAAAK